MGMFGIEFRAPSLPSWNDVTTAASGAVQGARDFGSAAVSRAADLGQSGIDLGRRAIADPEGTFRAVAADVRQGINHGVEGAQGLVRDGVMATGRGIGTAATFARDHVPGGDNVVSNALRSGITGIEDRARFSVGVVGGVTNEVVGLAGTVGTLATYGVELQVSPQARAELGTAIVGGVQQGGQALADYGRAVAADPSRLVTDAQAGATAAWNAGSGFVEGQIQRHQDAFARGEGYETLGMTTGQVATYLVPVGGGPLRGAVTASVEGAARLGTEAVVRTGTEALARTGTEALARTGTEALARTGTEALARTGTEAVAGQGARALTTGSSEAALRAAGTETRAVALATTPAAREAAEAAGARLVSGADAGGGTVRVARNGGVTAQDLAAASRQTGREVALYRDVASGERYVTFGTRGGVEVPGGSRLIAHTQPGSGAAAVRASIADEAALSRLGQGSSVIIDDAGTAATRFRATEEGAALSRTEGAGGSVPLRASTAPVPAAPILPGELNVGTYRELVAAGSKGDNLTPHHIPSANHMAQHGVAKADGIAINMEQPAVGGRHRLTATYGTQSDLALTPRQALAEGVADARRIYQQQGLYTPEVREALQALIDQNLAAFPHLFR